MTTKNNALSLLARDIADAGTIQSAAIPVQVLLQSGALDSATVISLIDSDYVSARGDKTKYLQLVQNGTLETTTGDAKWFAPAALNISQTSLRLGTASSGAGEYSLKKNGSAVVTFNIADGVTSATDATAVSLVAGDYLQVEVTELGDTAGADLSINITYQYV